MAAGWQARPGFNYRVSFEVHQVDEFLGEFFSWLKARGLYESSIIIITSDHGDATGELGRYSHSLVIYPEVMRVPLLIHLPSAMRRDLVYEDDKRVAALIDITPTLYYLLGHHPIVHHPLFGRPLFATTFEELRSYQRPDLFLASDVRAAYGILADHGRYFYATYDSPVQSYLFDLSKDPAGEHDILDKSLKDYYDQKVIDHLHALGDYYGYKPGLSSFAVASR
jgi:arylsulfatase A-like enzyme